jgi:quinol monooxygenase YgiN
MIALIARLTAKEGQESALEGVLRELGEQVRAHEPETKLFQLCKGKLPRQFVVIERYANQAALDAHGKSAYLGAAFKKMAPLLDGNADLEYLTEI